MFCDLYKVEQKMYTLSVVSNDIPHYSTGEISSQVIKYVVDPQ